MRATRFGTAALVVIALAWSGAAQQLMAGDAVSNVKSSLQQMHTWIDQGPNGAAWRTYLHSSDLESQLAAGDKADAKQVGKVLAKYRSGADGLQMKRFVAVRQALQAWQGELIQGDLAGYLNNASDTFRPVTAQDLKAAKAELQAAARGLRNYLTPGAANTKAWYQYLGFENLEAELSKDDPDLAVLGGMIQLYSKDHQGLELPEFTRLGDSLLRYGELATAANQDKLDTWYDAQLKKLATTITSYEAEPSLDDNEAIGHLLDQLQATNQAPGIVAAVRQKLSKPNLFVRASASLVGAGIARDVDQVDPITDNILGTSIRGTGHTIGNVSVGFVPNPNRAELETIFSAQSHTKTVGSNGPVTLYSRGVTTLRASKRILIDENGMADTPASAWAQSNNRVYSIAGGRIAQKIAWKRVGEKRSQANSIASQHAARRVETRLNAESAPELAKANRDLRAKVHAPLKRKRAYPELLKFSTDSDYLRIVSLQATRSQLGAPSEAPQSDVQADLAVRVHETMVNNLAETFLGGRKVTDDEMRDLVKELKDGELPERFQPQPDEDPWSITFARRDPVTVSFNENGYEATIRGSKYTSGDRAFGSMNVSAAYTFSLEDGHGKFVRQGDVTILPPGFEPGKDKLGASEIALTKILSKKFAKVFPAEIVSEGLKLPGKWGSVGKLEAIELMSSKGWLNAAWQIQLPEKVARKN